MANLRILVFEDDQNWFDAIRDVAVEQCKRQNRTVEVDWVTASRDQLQPQMREGMSNDERREKKRDLLMKRLWEKLRESRSELIPTILVMDLQFKGYGGTCYLNDAATELWNSVDSGVVDVPILLYTMRDEDFTTGALKLTARPHSVLLGRAVESRARGTKPLEDALAHAVRAVVR
jgi:hypothetical protein